MEFKDYYQILGVDPDADVKDIKKAYRRLARKYHPDVSSAGDAEARFKEVSEAYEVLGDETRRQEYDHIRQYGQAGGEFTPPPGFDMGDGQFQFSGGDFSEFFESIFNRTRGGFQDPRGGPRRDDIFSSRGQDVRMELPVLLEETLSDNERVIEYRLPQYDESGRVSEIKKTLNVKIPTGVVDGERIRLRGQGGQGLGQGAAGDLYLHVKLVPHPLFDAVGRDLHLTLPVAPWEAVLGAKVTVPTLSGKITMTIPAGSQAGQKLRAKGKGLPGKTETGDLIVVLKIVTPKQTDPASRQHWEALAQQAAFDPRAELER